MAPKKTASYESLDESSGMYKYRCDVKKPESSITIRTENKLDRLLVAIQHFHILLMKISTGELYGQPLNCQAGPWTNTATTRFLADEKPDFTAKVKEALGKF